MKGRRGGGKSCCRMEEDDRVEEEVKMKGKEREGKLGEFGEKKGAKGKESGRGTLQNDEGELGQRKREGKGERK